MAIDDFGFPIITEKATEEKTQSVDDFGFPIITKKATEEKTQSVDDFGFPLEKEVTEEKEYDTPFIQKYVADPLLGFTKGVTQLPDIVSGVVDTAGAFVGSPYSLGRGFDRLEEQLPDAFQDLGETLDSFKSQELKDKQVAAQKEIAKAEGFVDTAKTTIGTMLENPSLLFNTLTESLPATLTGGKIAQSLLKYKKLTSPIAAGAVGEGLVSEGLTAEGIRAQTEDGILSAKQAGIAGLSGIATSGFGAFGGKLNKYFDALDFDTVMAAGIPRKLSKDAALDVSNLDYLKRKATDAFKGAIIESTAEELPQSMQEQMAQNIALGKPAMEGVAEAGASGFLLGFTMGGGISLLAGDSRYSEVTPKLPPQNNTEYDTSQESIFTDIKTPVEEDIEIKKEKDPQIDMFEAIPESLEYTDDADVIKNISNIKALEKVFLDKQFKATKNSTAKEAAEKFLNQANKNSKYKGDLNEIFEIIPAIDKDGKQIYKLKKREGGVFGYEIIPAIDKDGKQIYKFEKREGGVSADEDTLTLEQEKERYEQSNIPEEFTGSGINERIDTEGNRVGNVVFGELDSADTDTETVKKSKRNTVDRTTDTSGGPNAAKVDSSSTLEFINKTDTESSLRNPAITKVLTDNPEILEIATTDETTISDTGLNPNQYKREYKKWEDEQKQNKEVWKKRKGNKKQLIKDFEGTIPSINNAMAEGLKPLQQERKVLNVAIREVVAKEYLKYTKSKRDERLKKYKVAAEKKLEKEYQRVNNVHKKKNKDAKDLTASEAAIAANNEKLKGRTVNKNKDKTIKNVTYFSYEKPQEFIEDKSVIEKINRETFSQDNYKNFRKALKNEGLLDQYNKEVDNIIANPPSAAGILRFDKENFVGEFNTAEARDKRLKDLNDNKDEDRPRVDGRIFVAYDAAGSAKKDQKGKYKIRDIVDENFETEIIEDTKLDKEVEDVSAVEEETVEDTSIPTDINKSIDDALNTKTTEIISDSANQELTVEEARLIQRLKDEIGLEGTTLDNVLKVLKDKADITAPVSATTYAFGQNDFQQNEIANLFTNLLKENDLARIFSGIKVKNNSKLKNRGEYNPKNNTISINFDLIRVTNVQSTGEVVIHEVVHSLLDRILEPKNIKRLEKLNVDGKYTDMLDGIANLQTQYKGFRQLALLKPKAIFKEPLKSIKEFVAIMFESPKLAIAIAETAAEIQREQKTKERDVQLKRFQNKRIKDKNKGPQDLADKSEDEFQVYLDEQINGTTSIRNSQLYAERNESGASWKNIISDFFLQAMTALGLRRRGANNIVQNTIRNSIKILVDPSFSEVADTIQSSSVSNYGNNWVNKGNKKLQKDFLKKEDDILNKEIEKYRDNNKFRNLSLRDKLNRLVEKIQNTSVRLLTWEEQLKASGLFKDNMQSNNGEDFNNLASQHTLIQGKAKLEAEKNLNPFIHNMNKALSHLKLITGYSTKLKKNSDLSELSAFVNLNYEALGEWSRAEWLFDVNMSLSNNEQDKFTIPRWKDETGKIVSITVTPFEFREKILDRMSVAEEAIAKGQASTNEVDKLRDVLNSFVEQQRRIAVGMLNKGVDPNWTSTERKIKSEAPKTVYADVYSRDSMLYSSGTLGASEKISSQQRAKEILEKLGINYDKNLSKMSAEQLATKQANGEAYSQEIIDAFMTLADHISLVADATKNVNRTNGYLPPQGDNIIRFMRFKYYKPLKRKDKNSHKVRDERYMNTQEEVTSKSLNTLESTFAGGQQELTTDVIAQLTADAIKSAMTSGYRPYTQAIANAARQTFDTDINGKIVSKKIAPFLKLKETLSYDDRYKINKLSDSIDKETGKKNIILNFRLDGKIDVIEITDRKFIAPLKGVINDIPKLVQWTSKLTSGIGQGHTRFSLPFAATNVQRDAVTNIPLLLIKHPKALIPYMGQLLGQIFRGRVITTWRYVSAMNRGRGDELIQRGLQKKRGSYEYNLAKYLDEGGQISYIRAVSTSTGYEIIEKGTKNRDSLLNTQILTGFFDAVIGTGEIAVRASAFTAIAPEYQKKALERVGNPKEGTKEYKDAMDGADITAAAEVKNYANFETSGEDSAYYAAYFMFFKPSMTSAVVNLKAIAPAFQSETEFLNSQNPDFINNSEVKEKLLAKFKQEKISALGVVFGGLGLGALLWSALASTGDDDDDNRNRNRTDDMERWIRNVRLPLDWMPIEVKDKLGIDRNKNIINMHWGFGNMGWPAMGVQITAFVDTHFNSNNTDTFPSDFKFMSLFSNLTAIAMDNFLPLPISRSKLTDDPVFFFVDSIAPSVVKPLVELTANTNSFGYDITRDRITKVGGAYGGKGSTDDIYKDFAEFLGRLSDRKIDIDPNKLKFYAESYLDGFMKIIVALGDRGDITDLESARKKTLVFKQFIATRTMPDMNRYNIVSKKILKLKTQQAARELDKSYSDYKQWEYDNSDTLRVISLFDFNNNKLKELYKIQKEYQLGKDVYGDRLDPQEQKNNILNIKLQINALMRESINLMRYQDESGALDLDGSWYTTRSQKSIDAVD